MIEAILSDKHKAIRVICWLILLQCHFYLRLIKMDTQDKESASVIASKELKALFEITNTNRRTAWHHRLIACLPHAVFSAGKPEIIYNDSGLTYYNLELDEDISKSSENANRYTVPELIDTFLINEGVGIAIEARNPERAIDLSYGDVLGYHLYRTFAEPDDHPFKTDKPRAQRIREGADILINHVPAEVLPAASIKLFEGIMAHFAINDPQIKLIYLPETDQHELVFSVNKEQLSPRKTQTLMQTLGWFLPRYYSYLATDMNDIASLFD